jgi:hypothetical protein
MLILYGIILFLFSIYSYALIDVNLTLLNNKYWAWFRGVMVNFGYNQRELSSIVYVIFVVILFGFFWYFVKNYKKYNPLVIAGIVGGILLFAYPFLSHDLFSYIFDAKIITHYHQNPYLMRPQDFPTDQWLRFLHWTHRTYPYGPSFILLTLIPSFLAGTKFILHFIFFKLFFLSFYLAAVWTLNRLNKKWVMIFAVHPLILIEGLMNSHNDLLAVSLGIIGISFVISGRNNLISRLLLVFSAGIKYLTFPLVFITKNRTSINRSIFIVFTGLMIYLCLTREIQPWYFLSFFVFLPFFENEIMQFNLFSFALLIINYFYIRYGVIDPELQSFWKNILLYVFFIINCAIVFWRVYIKRIPSRSEKALLFIILIIVSIITRFYMLAKTVQSIELHSNIYLVPSLFTLAVILFIIIKSIPFLTKTITLLFVISSDFVLFNTRQFSYGSLYSLITVIFIELIIIYSLDSRRSLPRTLIQGGNDIFEHISIYLRNIFIYGALFICLFFVLFLPIRYFSKDFGVMTLYYQKGITDAIVEYKSIWERDQKVNKKPIIYENAINIRQFPDSSSQKATVYLLKKQFNLTISQRGLPFIICYFDVCKKEYYIEGNRKHGNLILPNFEKVSFDKALIIYEVPGKIEVYGFR